MYHITLTKDDIKTITFVGSRYCWSNALLSIIHDDDEEARREALAQLSRREESDVIAQPLRPYHLDGQIVLALKEYEAWNLVDSFEEDTKGNHSLFPMLDPRSDLYEELIIFMDRVI